MKIAICDDVFEYRKSIRAYAENYAIQNNLNCKFYEYEDGDSLDSSNINFDIVFLDIELGDSNGIDIAKHIQRKNKNAIILIVTSYIQYLDDAMDINVLRYISKPVTQQKIDSALNKAISKINEEVITLHLKGNEITKIKKSNVVYAEAKIGKVLLYTETECYSLKNTIKELRQMLNASYFATPHNSYIVNLNCISNFKREEITVRCGKINQKISVSTRNQPDFKRKFLNFIGEDIDNE